MISGKSHQTLNPTTRDIGVPRISPNLYRNRSPKKCKLYRILLFIVSRKRNYHTGMDQSFSIVTDSGLQDETQGHDALAVQVIVTIINKCCSTWDNKWGCKWETIPRSLTTKNPLQIRLFKVFKLTVLLTFLVLFCFLLFFHYDSFSFT